MSSPAAIFQYKEKRRKIVNFSLYAQLILDLKKRKTWLLFLLLHPCTPWVRAQPYMQLIQPPAQPKRQKIWSGREEDGGGTLQGEMFYKVPNTFSSPTQWGLLSLHSWQMPSQGFVCSSLVRGENSLGNF